MKKILVLLSIVVLLVGCGEVSKESGADKLTATGYNDIGNQKKVFSMLNYEAPTKNAEVEIINRAFNSTECDKYIRFIEGKATIEINSIWYNTIGFDQVMLNVNPGNAGKVITVWFRGGHGTVIVPDDNSNTLAVVTGFIPTSNTVTPVHLVEDVLVTSNVNDFIILTVDGELIENYWLSDFFNQP